MNYKNLSIIGFILFFSGCSIKEIDNMHISKIFEPTNKNFITSDYTKKTSVAEDVIKFEKDIFPNEEDIKYDETVLMMDDNTLIKIKSIEYTDLKTVYDHVSKNQTLSSYNLKAVDYLKLYKVLRLNQEQIFKNLKVTIIGKFMQEIENYPHFDLDKVYLMLLEEQMDKIDTLIQELYKIKELQ